MEGTDFDKHFKGYQPQLVVESAEIEAEEMLAAGSEADDSVPPLHQLQIE